jgi:hypothetical protein
MIMGLTIGAIFKMACGFVFDNPVGKALAGLTLAVGVFSTWLFFHDAKIEQAAKTEVITDINKQAEVLTDDALKARAAAERPGAFGRLRKGSCTDCNGKTVLSGGETRVH